MGSNLEAARCRIARLLFALVLVAFVATTGWLVFGRHLESLGALGIPTMQPRFVDARVFTGATVALERGLDPLVTNPADPLARPLNYPRVWLLLADLGVGPEHATALALAFFTMFVGGLALLLPVARTSATALSLAVAVFSPAVWLAVERGNADLALFGLVALAAWLTARRPRLACGAVATAAVLKLYPIGATFGLIGEQARSSLRRVAPLLAGFALYLAWIAADLPRILTNTYYWRPLSYGLEILPVTVARELGWPSWPLLIAAGAIVGAVLAAAVRARRRIRLGDATVPHALAAFRMGAVIFIGTWCLHTHFDYRLVFLLLTVPQIVRWCGAEHGAIRAGARIALAALSLVLWSLAWRHGLERAIGSAVPGLMLDAALGWLLAATLLVGTVLSLPDWAVPRACRGAPLVDLPVVPAGAILSLPLDGGHRRPDRGFGAGSA